ncbi:MAG: PEGA domain-containing protein [Deltaproteobacteria bacterium]|nr:MAG: PEGA domain-containing protein [Deltaproteobacteria bacterium]
MLRRSLSAAVALCLWLAVDALAYAKPTVAILGLEVIDDGSGIDERSTAFAAEFTNALRHRAMLGKGSYQLAPNSNKDLLELKLLSDCADEGRACMAAIGRELRADALMYGKVEKRAEGFQVSLKLLNVETGTMERTLSEIVPYDAAAGDKLNEWARTLYNRLTGVPDTGSVRVRANASKGTVYVDGEVKTTLSAGGATVSGLSEGVHALAVESDGFDRYESQITISPGEVLDVTVHLEPATRGGPERPGKVSRVLFWTSVVATGASVAAFTITGTQVRSLEDDKQEQFERLVANGADVSNAPRDSNGDFTDVCAIAENNRGVAGAQDLIDTCEKGRNRALLTNVLIGTSVATALAATYFYYKGYIEPGGADSREAGAVTVTPAVGPGVVGAGVEITF